MSLALVRTLGTLVSQVSQGQPGSPELLTTLRPLLAPGEATIPEGAREVLAALVGGEGERFRSGEVLSAAHTTLIELGTSLDGDTEVAMEALATLAPGATPSFREVSEFCRFFGLGTVENRDLPGLFAAAVEAIVQGGVPSETRLAPNEIGAMEAALAALDFDFAHGIRVPKKIEWKADARMRGVGHGKVLVRNDAGSVVVPIFMAAGSVYSEHVHLGREQVVFYPGSGEITDAQGTYSVTSGNYVQPPASVHTPSVKNFPGIFLGVAEGGVVFTGLPPGKGGSLLRTFGVSPDLLLRLFAGVPLDTRDHPHRTTHARSLFQGLDLAGRWLEPEDTEAVGRVTERLEGTAGLAVADRLEKVNARGFARFLAS